MKYTLEQHSRAGEMRWVILREGEVVASVGTYSQAVKIVNELNDQKPLVGRDCRERLRVKHLRDVLTARRFRSY